MGPELAAAAPLLGAGATLVGTMMQQSAADDAAQRQRQQLAANQSLDDQYQKRAINLVDQNAQQYAPEQRQANTQTAIDNAGKSLTGELVAARDNAAAPAATSGSVSQDFTTGQAKTAAGELQRSTNIAKLMASMRGPTDLRANEAMINADFAGRGGSLGNDRQAMANAGTTDLNAIHPDGSSMLLGGLGQQVGLATLGNSLKKKASAGGLLSDYSAGIDQSGMY